MGILEQPMKVRRVVTGHDPYGNAIIKFDDAVEGIDVKEDSETAVASFALIWTTDTHPADNLDEFDGGQREVGLTSPGGNVFRVIDFYPGQRSPMHRTQSLDYGIVLDGEIDMELDSGQRIRLKAGDVVVQRGTIHAWINCSAHICRMAFILTDAEPVSVGGSILPATH